MSSEDLVAASRRSLFEFTADAFYAAPITELALLHAASSSLPPPPSVVANTFFYVVNYSTDANNLNADMQVYSLGAALTDGVDPFSTDIIYSTSDKLLSEIVLYYWTQFIRMGCVVFLLVVSFTLFTSNNFRLSYSCVDTSL